MITPTELDDHPALKKDVDAAQELCNTGRWSLAIGALKQLLTQNYALDLVTQMLATAYMNSGQMRDAIHWYEAALSHNPKLFQSQENLIFLVDALPETTHERAQQVRQDWWKRFGAAAYAQRQPHTNTPDPHKRLRVGYVSSDFRFHSAAVAFTAVIMDHTEQIEPVYYSTLERTGYDETTKQQWIDRVGPAFVDASKWSAAVLANTIRNDEIDILVDLSGYTYGNRMLTFAHHPAPIQISAWGYVTGSASPALDVIFADPYVAPPDVCQHITERVVYLPSLLTYNPRPDLPEANTLPCLTNPPIFGVYQRAMKLNDDVLNVYRQILDRVPNSQIIFRGPDYSPDVKTWMFTRLNGYCDRIHFGPHLPHREHMLWYQLVDLSLDPWPQTGGVSTLEALWMGVPAVTLLGSRLIQRTTASFHATMGLAEDFVAMTREEYVEKAVELVTTKRDFLADLRANLRERLQKSPIMAGYRDAVEARYRELWQEWCAKPEQRSVA